jgi:hypothetical protein
MPMPTAEQITQLQTTCDEITKDPISGLIMNPDWGRINFDLAKRDLDMIFAIAHLIRNAPLDLLPETDFNALRDALKPIAVQIGNMRAFSVESGTPNTARDSIVNTLRAQTDQLYAQSQARLPFLALQRGDVRRNEEKIGRAVHEATKLLAQAETDAKEKNATLDGIIHAARDASASVGVAHFTADFTGTATKLETAAGSWLIVTAILGAVTIAGAVAFPFIFPATGDVFDMKTLQLFTSKLVALGGLFTAAIWCGHMYKATKHQAAINTHRGNALKTFQAFIAATSDDQTRNAVLMETTRSIFAMTSTGYLDAVENPGDGALKILEVVKTAASAGK